MFHQPNNQSVTQDEKLKAKVGDTFKCSCSIFQEDSDGQVYQLNSWKLENDGWYHFGSTNGKPIREHFHMHNENEWVKICGRTSEPFDTLPEVVSFT
jgi:hypothetical protein